MTLKRSVGIAIVAFALLVLFFWMLGYLFTAQPPSDEAKQNAAQNGLFDPSAPPIIH